MSCYPLQSGFISQLAIIYQIKKKTIAYNFTVGCFFFFFLISYALWEIICLKHQTWREKKIKKKAFTSSSLACSKISNTMELRWGFNDFKVIFFTFCIRLCIIHWSCTVHLWKGRAAWHMGLYNSYHQDTYGRGIAGKKRHHQ